MVGKNPYPAPMSLSFIVPLGPRDHDLTESNDATGTPEKMDLYLVRSLAEITTGK